MVFPHNPASVTEYELSEWSTDAHIGMIVGIGPAATDYYYRYLISALAREGRDLQLTMAHADTPTLLRHHAENSR